MGENVICTFIRFSWVPIALFSIVVTSFLVIKKRRETDLLEKDRIGSKIKYPLLLLFLSLVSIPLWDFLILENILPIDCTTDIFTPTKLLAIREFSDGSTHKNISLPLDGGFNSDISIRIPRGATVVNAKIELNHPPNESFIDEFNNWTLLESHDGADINTSEGGFTYLKARNLIVDDTITMEGTQIFDEITIRKGGRIRVPQESKLNLIVKGVVIIDAGAGIDVSGDPAKQNRGDEYSVPAQQASGGGGGGYGGDGGKGGDEVLKGGEGGLKYGFENDPYMVGNDGARGAGTTAPSGSGFPGAGGAGGGALRLEAIKILVDGYISANGGNGEDSEDNDGTGGGGAGSGGSISIITKNLILNGKISADGGKGGDDRQGTDQTKYDGAGGGGGGGRISITYSKKAGIGEVSAKGGLGGRSGQPTGIGENGKDGTIGWFEKELSGLSIIYTNITSVEIKPDNLKNWERFYANSTTDEGGTLEYRIIDPEDNSTLCSMDGKQTDTWYEIGECVKQIDSIKIQANMVTMSILRGTRIYQWKVEYQTNIKDLEVDLGIDQAVEYQSPLFVDNITLSDENTNPKITEEINRLSRKCDCRGCMPSEQYCEIKIRFSSKSSGLLEVYNPDIAYSLSE